MEQTGNYGLNQWDGQDRILREDFNADNAKIEAALTEAIGNTTYVKLKEVTTTEDLAQIDINFSDIDLSQFQALKLFIYAKTMSFGVRINGGNSYYGSNNFSESNSSQAYLVSSCVGNSSPNKIQAELSISGMFSPSEWQPLLAFMVSGNSGKITGSTGSVALSTPLSQLSIICNHNSSNLGAGTSIVVYGLRT